MVPLRRHHTTTPVPSTLKYPIDHVVATTRDDLDQKATSSQSALTFPLPQFTLTARNPARRAWPRCYGTPPCLRLQTVASRIPLLSLCSGQGEVHKSVREPNSHGTQLRYQVPAPHGCAGRQVGESDAGRVLEGHRADRSQDFLRRARFSS